MQMLDPEQQIARVEKMFKPFSYLNGRVFIVLSAGISLLIGWSPPVGGNSEPAATVEPSGVTSKTVADTEEKSAEVSVPAPLSFSGKTVNVPSDETGMWVERFKELVEGIQKEMLASEDADKFYAELNTALNEKRNDLRNALAISASAASSLDKVSDKKAPSESSAKAAKKQKSQETVQPGQETEARDSSLDIPELLQAEMTVLYYLRNQVLGIVSSGFRSRITGTGIDGIQSAKAELEYILLTFRCWIHKLPQMGRRTITNLLSDPVPVLLVILRVSVAVVIFLWWRHWALKGIPGIRNKILDVTPRKWINIALANLLWYLNHVRSPLEWGLMLSICFNIVDTTEGQILHGLLWLKVKWFLMAWFAVAFVGAMSTRGATGRDSKSANLRMRSIWLFAIWTLVVALASSITADVAGKGTIYVWVRTFSKVLVVPVLLLLTYWWRPEIYRILENETHRPVYVKKILQYQRGLRSYFGAVIGAVYLIVNHFRLWLLKGVTTFEGGRFLIANLTRLEAMRVSERQQQKSKGKPISDDMHRRLFEADDDLVESYCDSHLDRMADLVRQRKKGAAVLVAERGGGRTQLLRRLDRCFEEKLVIFECPIGGFEKFQEAFAESLDLQISDFTTETITERLQEAEIEIIGIDNIDRLSRPVLGGQRELDRLAELVRAVQGEVFWFFGVNWAAWQYISSVRASGLFLDDVIMLPAWTEVQIRQLVELRSSRAGIKPDFGELSLPRQFEDIDYDTVEERNRYGFFRILWNASDGNPIVALQLWADSLRVLPDSRIQVSLPQLPATSELENVHITVLLTLRVIAQSEMANQEEIIASLRFPANEIAGALRLATNRGWVELVNGRYRLSWKWFRSITRVLARQNLLVRKALGG
jgi:hypothetical protein